MKTDRWKTLDDAAEELACRFHRNDPVRCKQKLLTDVLTGILNISIRFPVVVKARKGTFRLPNEFDGHKEISVCRRAYSQHAAGESFLASIGIDNSDGLIDDLDNTSFEYEGGVIPISAVWDLAMVGNERIILENIRRKDFLPEIAEEVTDGFYVRDPSTGEFLEIQSDVFYKDEEWGEQHKVVPEITLPKGAEIVFRKSCLEEYFLKLSAGQENTDIKKPTLITIENATAEGQLDRFHLLRMAEQGQDVLELLVYVDYGHIVGGVAVPSIAREPGYYLALPTFDATRLITKGDAYVQSFILPKAYLPPCAGLVVLQQIIVQSRDHTIGTREPYHIKLDQDKIWVVRQQVEKFFKRTLEEHVLAQPYSLEPPQQAALTGRLYKGTKEIPAAFAAHGRPVSMRQIRNYKKQGLEIIPILKGKKEIPTVTELAIVNFLFQEKMNTN